WTLIHTSGSRSWCAASHVSNAASSAKVLIRRGSGITGATTRSVSPSAVGGSGDTFAAPLEHAADAGQGHDAAGGGVRGPQDTRARLREDGDAAERCGGNGTGKQVERRLGHRHRAALRADREP